jgi:putative membrane protein
MEGSMGTRRLVRAAGGALLLSVALTVGAADIDNTEFLKEAIQGNLAEVEVGNLAQQKGATQGVKDFGAMLVKDHQMANEKAMQIAQQLSVQVPDKPDMKQRALAEKLAGLSGPKFDKEFAESMVKDHNEDIAKYQQESRLSGPAADYAKATLPTLHEHLKMAENLQSAAHVASKGGAH